MKLYLTAMTVGMKSKQRTMHCINGMKIQHTLQNPPFFEGLSVEPGKVEPLKGLRVVAKFGDSVTTDHISPAGAIGKDTPAGKYLQEKGVSPTRL